MSDSIVWDIMAWIGCAIIVIVAICGFFWGLFIGFLIFLGRLFGPETEPQKGAKK